MVVAVILVAPPVGRCTAVLRGNVIFIQSEDQQTLSIQVKLKKHKYYKVKQELYWCVAAYHHLL